MNGQVLAKSGAEGIQLGVVPSAGLGVVVKSLDGGDRGTELGFAALLEALGVINRQVRDTLINP